MRYDIVAVERCPAWSRRLPSSSNWSGRRGDAQRERRARATARAAQFSWSANAERAAQAYRELLDRAKPRT